MYKPLLALIDLSPLLAFPSQPPHHDRTWPPAIRDTYSPSQVGIQKMGGENDPVKMTISIKSYLESGDMLG